MKKSITVLVLAGPSAGGKTASATELLRRDGRFTLLRSATTRAPRGDGHDGEYIYLSEDEFRREISSGGIVEYMEYAGNIYGTPLSELRRAESEGKIPLLILDLVGVESISRIHEISPCSLYIFTDPDVIRQRLRDRYLKQNCDEAARNAYLARVEQNRRDYERIPEYAHLFYAFLGNSGTLNELADNILTAFDRFLSGKEADKGENMAIASSLSKM